MREVIFAPNLQYQIGGAIIMRENFAFLDAMKWDGSSSRPCVNCGTETKEWRKITYSFTRSREVICKSCFQKLFSALSRDYVIPGLDYRWENDEASYQKTDDKYSKLTDSKWITREGEFVIACYHSPRTGQPICVMTTYRVLLPDSPGNPNLSRNISYDDIKGIGFDRENIEIIYRDLDRFKSYSARKLVYEDQQRTIFNTDSRDNAERLCRVIIHLMYLFETGDYCFDCNQRIWISLSDDDASITQYDFDSIAPFKDGSIASRQETNTFLADNKASFFHETIDSSRLKKLYVLLCPSCQEKHAATIRNEASEGEKSGKASDDGKNKAKIREMYLDVNICENCRTVFYDHKFVALKYPSRPIKLFCEECFRSQYPEYADNMPALLNVDDMLVFPTNALPKTSLEGSASIAASPQDSPSHDPKAPEQNAKKLRKEFIHSLFQKYNGIPKLYFQDHGKKAKEKIARAVDAYAYDTEPEQVILVYDVTLFGGADDGFLMTDSTIYVHNMAEDEIAMSYSDIVSIRVENDDDQFKIRLNDRHNNTVLIETNSYERKDVEKIVEMINIIKNEFNHPVSIMENTAPQSAAVSGNGKSVPVGGESNTGIGFGADRCKSAEKNDKVPCPSCGTETATENKFCDECGANLNLPSKKKCPSCGTEVDDDESFCTECGAPLTAPPLCPNCGAELKTGKKFCGKCGTKVVQ